MTSDHLHMNDKKTPAYGGNDLSLQNALGEAMETWKLNSETAANRIVPLLADGQILQKGKIDERAEFIDALQDAFGNEYLDVPLVIAGIEAAVKDKMGDNPYRVALAVNDATGEVTADTTDRRIASGENIIQTITFDMHPAGKR